MANGLELELLMQLFFVLEGLSLWKVATPATRIVTDLSSDNEICDKILANFDNIPEREKHRNQFLKVSRSYKKWRRAASLVCSFAPLTFFAIMVIILSFFFDIKNGGCLLFLNGITVIYFTAKSTIVWGTKYYVGRYDTLLKNITTIQSSTTPNKLQSI